MLTAFADGGAPRYRTIDEARIVDMMLVFAWPHNLRYGDAARAAGDARAALRHCVALGLQFADAPGGVRLFDPAEVTNFIIWAGLRGADRLWEDRFVSTGRRLALDLHPTPADAACPPPPSLPPARYRISLHRTFNLHFAPPAARVRLRLPLPLEGRALADLRLTPIPPLDGQDVEFSRSAGRLDATLRHPVGQMVTLGFEASFTASSQPDCGAADRLTAEDLQLYTRPSEGLVQVTPRVAALAARLAGAMEEPADLAKRFWRFVIATLACGAVRYDQLPPAAPLDWLLDLGWCDCQLGSALVVALCRARGVPARLCSGYLLSPLGPFYHYWSEMWAPPRGWLPFDLSVSGLSVGGRDQAWLEYFEGRIDHRARTECLPRLFTGFGSLRLPARWQILRRALPDSVETSLYCNDTGEPIFMDRVRVHEPTLDRRYARGFSRESAPPNRPA
jgi:hypothetical protein